MPGGGDHGFLEGSGLPCFQHFPVGPLEISRLSGFGGSVHRSEIQKFRRVLAREPNAGGVHKLQVPQAVREIDHILGVVRDGAHPLVGFGQFRGPPSDTLFQGVIELLEFAPGSDCFGNIRDRHQATGGATGGGPFQNAVQPADKLGSIQASHLEVAGLTLDCLEHAAEVEEEVVLGGG